MLSKTPHFTAKAQSPLSNRPEFIPALPLTSWGCHLTMVSPDLSICKAGMVRPLMSLAGGLGTLSKLLVNHQAQPFPEPLEIKRCEQPWKILRN